MLSSVTVEKPVTHVAEVATNSASKVFNSPLCEIGNFKSNVPIIIVKRKPSAIICVAPIFNLLFAFISFSSFFIK